MEPIETCLELEDFTRRLDLPSAFELAEMQAYWVQLRENWLNDLLPATDEFWAAVPGTETETVRTAAIRPLMKRFAVYAIYANYILQGSFRQTKVGLRIKDGENSKLLEAEEVARLHRYYLDQATAAAKLLQAAAEPQGGCQDVPGAAGPVRVRAVVPRNTSPF